jgi:hypothetical protein
MRPNGYFWVALSALFCSVSARVLVDSVRGSGPYAEEYILLGGTLAGLGVAAMFFAVKQRAQIRALAQHMGRYSQSSRRLKARRMEKKQ